MKAILYDWGGANVWLFHLVNNLRGSYLDRIMLLGTRLGDHGNFPLYLALLAVAGVWALGRTPPEEPGRYRLRATAWLTAVAVFGAAYVLDGWLIGWLKPLFDFPRPLLALPAGALHVVGVPEYHHSLPSGHASFAMVLAAGVWPLLGPGGRGTAAAFVLWVGLSRVSLGAHFPADVLAGYLSALAVVLLVRAALTAVGKRGAGP